MEIKDVRKQAEGSLRFSKNNYDVTFWEQNRVPGKSPA